MRLYILVGKGVSRGILDQDGQRKLVRKPKGRQRLAQMALQKAT
jgi:hypothetical protein